MPERAKRGEGPAGAMPLRGVSTLQVSELSTELLPCLFKTCLFILFLTPLEALFLKGCSVKG